MMTYRERLQQEQEQQTGSMKCAHAEDEQGEKEGGASPGRRKRRRPEQEKDGAPCRPWRRFLPPYGPASPPLDLDGAVAVLRDRVQRLCKEGTGRQAAVGTAVELLVGRWARERWGQQGPLLPCLDPAAAEGAGDGAGSSAGDGAAVSSTAAAAEGEDGRRHGAWRDAHVSYD